MKREALKHPKTAQLAHELGVPIYSAVGILESFWKFVVEYAPAGDVGKHCPASIATWVGWQGDADVLVKALAEARWIDADPSCTWRVHDWPEHCEDHVHMKLARAGKFFADGQIPSLTRFSSKDKRLLIKQFYSNAECAHGQRMENALPNPTQPSLAQPCPTQPCHAIPDPATPPNGNGNGEISDGNGSGQMGGIGELSAEFLKQGILSKIVMNSRDRKHIIDRRDISPANLRAVIKDIETSGTADDVGACLIYRLCRKKS